MIYINIHVHGCVALTLEVNENEDEVNENEDEGTQGSADEAPFTDAKGRAEEKNKEPKASTTTPPAKASTSKQRAKKVGDTSNSWHCSFSQCVVGTYNELMEWF